jgi:hypothetical protein
VFNNLTHHRERSRAKYGFAVLSAICSRERLVHLSQRQNSSLDLFVEEKTVCNDTNLRDAAAGDDLDDAVCISL